MNYRVLYQNTGTEHLIAVPNDNRTFCGLRLLPGLDGPQQGWIVWDDRLQVSWYPTKKCKKCQEAA